jgi:hypothetical protein
MLLLLLGIAINGNFKEKFIEQIQQNLDTDLQVKLVPFLSLVTDDINFAVPRSILVELGGSEISEFSNTPKQQTVTNGMGADLVSSTLGALVNNNSHDINESQDGGVNGSTSVLKYQSVCDVNYFLNEKLMPNLQRVVNERDSYLELITELQQDKDFLTTRVNSMCLQTNPLLGSSANNILNVNNSSNGSSGGIDANGQPIGGSSGSSGGGGGGGGCGFNDKQFLLDALTTICSANGGRDGSGEIEPGTSLVNLSDTQTLMMLFDSIYKEISITNANMSGLGETVASGASNGACLSETINVGHSANGKSASSFLSDLRGRTMLTNNWNQKIAIELVECKMKLKQLINEM